MQELQSALRQLNPLQNELLIRGAIKVSKRADVPNNPHYVYASINGPHIIQIGKGRINRPLALLPDSRGMIRHQKTFITALSNGLHGDNFSHYVIPCASDNASKRLETKLQWEFGETLIDGIKLWRRKEIALILLDQLVSKWNINLDSKLGELMKRAAVDEGEAMVEIYSDFDLRWRFSNLTGRYFDFKWINRWKKYRSKR